MIRVTATVHRVMGIESVEGFPGIGHAIGIVVEKLVVVRPQAPALVEGVDVFDVVSVEVTIQIIVATIGIHPVVALDAVGDAAAVGVGEADHIIVTIDCTECVSVQRVSAVDEQFFAVIETISVGVRAGRLRQAGVDLVAVSEAVVVGVIIQRAGEHGVVDEPSVGMADLIGIIQAIAVRIRQQRAGVRGLDFVAIAQAVSICVGHELAGALGGLLVIGQAVVVLVAAVGAVEVISV